MRRLRGRRLLFWVLCGSPLFVAALALTGAAALDVLGAHCTYPNTPMRLDGEAKCNALGQLRDDLGWTALAVVMACVPIAALTAIGGLVVRQAAAARARRVDAGG